MATREVALSPTTWTKISEAGHTHISVWLGKYNIDKLNGPVAVSVQVDADDCDVRNSVILTHAIVAATSMPVGDGESAYALWLGPNNPDPYIVVQGD